MYRTLDDLDVAGKRVLVRLDLNVPMKGGQITDATRIERQAPTVRELSEMRYLFQEPFVVDSSKIRDRLGVVATPVEEALATTMAGYRSPTR